MKLPDRGELEALRRIGDRNTDDLVTRMAQRHSPVALAALLDLLIHWDPLKTLPETGKGVTPGLLAEAQAFLRTPGFLDDAIPGGVDWDRIRRAQDFYASHQALGLLILGCGSLPACYSIPGVAQVLMGSGRLALQVRGRLGETIAFLTQVMTPGSLGAGDGVFCGNLWIRKVCLMHGLMRCLMRADPDAFNHLSENTPSGFLGKYDWSERAGKDACPIDQVELAFVLLTFSWMVIRGLRILWVGMDRQQAEDHLYTWSVIGHGLGIRAGLRPHTEADALALFDQIRHTYEDGTEAGRLLVAALVVYIIFRLRQGVREMLPPWLLKILVTYFRRFGSGCLESLARTFVRVLTGASTADKLWVPRAPLLHWAAGLLVRLAILAKDAFKPGDKGLSRLLGEQLSMRDHRR